mgnify:CR=1 FL=1
MKVKDRQSESKSSFISKDDDRILEVFIDNEEIKLGTLRNIALQFVPPNAIWTTWDDDDWRHPNYISIMMKKMLNKNVGSTESADYI